MRLFDLCTSFDASQNSWAHPNPARALPFDLRAKVRLRFGGIFAASDITRRRSPSRLGVSLRSYERGDPTRTLATHHYLRTGELLTRTDSAPGRQSACIVFHGYETLLFQSADSLGNKGQVALTVAAIIQEMHASVGHVCKIHFSGEKNLPETLVSLQKTIRKSQSVYILTDLLFDPSSRDSASERLAEALFKCQVRHPSLFVIRDPLEWVENNPLVESPTELLTFKGAGAAGSHTYSGNAYLENLVMQMKVFEQSDTLKSPAQVITGNHTLESVISNLSRTFVQKGMP